MLCSLSIFSSGWQISEIMFKKNTTQGGGSRHQLSKTESLLARKQIFGVQNPMGMDTNELWTDQHIKYYDHQWIVSKCSLIPFLNDLMIKCLFSFVSYFNTLSRVAGAELLQFGKYVIRLSVHMINYSFRGTFSKSNKPAVLFFFKKTIHFFEIPLFSMHLYYRNI